MLKEKLMGASKLSLIQLCVVVSKQRDAVMLNGFGCADACEKFCWVGTRWDGQLQKNQWTIARG